MSCRTGVTRATDKLLYTTDGINFVDKETAPSNAFINPQTKRAPNRGFAATRWNLRFQGLFQSDPRKATATPVAGASPEPTPFGSVTGENCPNDEPCFIASRKTFNIEMQHWWDFWANNAFSLGPYFAVGATAALDDNELQGEAVTSPTPEGGESGGASTNAASSNDLKKFFDFGLISNILLFDKKLFVQSIVGGGHYEALGDLYDGHNTKWRMIGKLRVFPSGLDRSFGRQVEAAPMFGVDLNASRGPDHIKFFTGFAIKIRGFNVGAPSIPE
ncbi:MAG: hypothetical protein H0T60_01475 [Acidobacteria bacterium]|nr:hypothetical protein [Acidobacteriota bacterium]